MRLSNFNNLRNNLGIRSLYQCAKNPCVLTRAKFSAIWNEPRVLSDGQLTEDQLPPRPFLPCVVREKSIHDPPFFQHRYPTRILNFEQLPWRWRCYIAARLSLPYWSRVLPPDSRPTLSHFVRHLFQRIETSRDEHFQWKEIVPLKNRERSETPHVFSNSWTGSDPGYRAQSCFYSINYSKKACTPRMSDRGIHTYVYKTHYNGTDRDVNGDIDPSSWRCTKFKDPHRALKTPLLPGSRGSPLDDISASGPSPSSCVFRPASSSFNRFSEAVRERDEAKKRPGIVQDRGFDYKISGRAPHSFLLRDETDEPTERRIEFLSKRARDRWETGRAGYRGW